MKKNFQSNRTWLWWMAFLVLITGGVITFLISQQPMNVSTQAAMAKSIAITVVTAGVCIICATAEWWLHR